VKLVVSLDNLARQLTGEDGDADRVAWFTDRVIGAAGPAAPTADGLYWYLEPNDYQERPDYRAAISPRLDRVLAHAYPDAALIRWITPRALSELGLPAEAASERAWSNLDAAARRAPLVTTAPVDGVTLLSFAAGSPSSASLLLAPSLREVASGVVGWPVLAVPPARDRDADRRAFRRIRTAGKAGTARAMPQPAAHRRQPELSYTNARSGAATIFRRAELAWHRSGVRNRAAAVSRNVSTRQPSFEICRSSAASA
jgi:hypothetical protein